MDKITETVVETDEKIVCCEKEKNIVTQIISDQNYMIKTFTSIREAIYELDVNILGLEQKPGDFFETRPICIGSLEAIKEDNICIAKMCDSLLISLREYVKALKLESE